VYVTPYLDPNQITSGTLSYALGAGKAVVSTPYLHAKEALADDRGILVDFHAADQIAEAVNTILDDPKLKARLEKNAYRYANEATWPKTGARFLDVMRELVAEHAPVQKERRREKPLTVAHRLRGNPLIKPGDVEPQPGFEVISTINPGVATVGDETVLLVRVTERPRPEPGRMLGWSTSRVPSLGWCPSPAGSAPSSSSGWRSSITSRNRRRS
jgi:Glycosyltransferase